MVFDNAQRPGDLAGMLPGGGGHVLITSRNRAWSGIATQVDLGEFSRAEAVKFLCQRSGSDEPEAAASWRTSWVIFRWRWRRLRPTSIRGR